MRATIKYLLKDQKPKLPYAVAKGVLKAGDYGYNSDNEIVQVNQSTCVWHENIVIGPVNEGVNVVDGEEVEILFKCKKRNKCGYPFCGSSCEGNDGFWVAGKEERGY